MSGRFRSFYIAALAVAAVGLIGCFTPREHAPAAAGYVAPSSSDVACAHQDERVARKRLSVLGLLVILPDGRPWEVV